MENENVFEIVSIKFGSKESNGRPFEFNLDNKGDIISPKTYITSCPECGHGVNVNYYDIGKACCDNCGLGIENIDINNVNNEDIEEEIDNEINIEEDDDIDDIDDIIKDIIGESDGDCDFIDPIETGLMSLE